MESQRCINEMYCLPKIIPPNGQNLFLKVTLYPPVIALLQGCHCELSATLRSRQAPGAMQSLCPRGDCFAKLAMTRL